MSFIYYYDDINTIQFATTYTFLQSPYDMNLYEIQKSGDFNNAKKLINTIQIAFDCNSKHEYELYIANYKHIVAPLLKEDEEYLMWEIKRDWNSKITVPFKVFYLFTQFHKFYENFKISNVISWELLMDLDSKIITEYNWLAFDVSMACCISLFRWTLETNITCWGPEDYEILRKAMDTLGVHRKNNELIEENKQLQKLYKAIRENDSKNINTILTESWCGVLKNKLDISDEIYEQHQYLLDYSILFNLFFDRHYTFCLWNDFSKTRLRIWKGIVVCDSAFVWEYVTWKGNSWIYITQNMNYTNILQSEVWSNWEKLKEMILEFRNNVLWSKHKKQDSLIATNKFLKKCLDEFTKVEFYLSTKFDVIDKVKVIAIEKDPMKFSETKEKMPVNHPVSTEKWNGNKPYRIYEWKKQIKT